MSKPLLGARVTHKEDKDRGTGLVTDQYDNGDYVRVLWDGCGEFESHDWCAREYIKVKPRTR